MPSATFGNNKTRSASEEHDVAYQSRTANPSPLHPSQTYNGGYDEAKTVRLRVANGGAGQSGLVGALADAFVRWCVKDSESHNYPREAPFLVEWYLGDTTQSLSYLASGWVDVALTYNEAAEMALLKRQQAVKRELVFVDHFYLVGPASNPAGLAPGDSVHEIFSKIAAGGAQDAVTPPTSKRPPIRFLSRFDKSATNIKESELFIKIGQVPWAAPTAVWYHLYPRFPQEALRAASVLEEYTLTDRKLHISHTPQRAAHAAPLVDSPDVSGDLINLASPAQVANRINDDNDEESDRALLNPCNALLGASKSLLDPVLAAKFMRWLVALDGGQKVVREFTTRADGWDGEVIYQPAI
ncbi:hypothetical protein GYMLUDRAFT_239395 [Collybiopsis luxurians FD-317 M1]|nr:hypothetical protein GYMLUDRAFT_239395 [Collybiopsis luxurians FD-317 M1]